MRRVFVSEPLEVVAAVLLTAAAVTLGVVFHRAALSVLFALVTGAAAIVYFAHVYADVAVTIPARRRDRQPGASPEPAAGVRWRCGICDQGPEIDHTQCTQVVARTAASMRRPRDP